MNSPKEIYESFKRINNINNIAYERLFENYLKYELKKDEKLIDIDSTDQESVLKGRPFEGMIYTFINVNDTNLANLTNLKNGKTIEFHDYTPIVFCTSFNPLTSTFKGLNLNMLPKLERLKFFQAYWEYYKDFLIRIEEKTEYNKVAINHAYRLAAWIGKNPVLFKIFNTQQNALFEYAYRTYNIKNVTKFRMIEYQEWPYIMFYEAKHAFKKINLEILYKIYYDYKNSK